MPSKRAAVWDVDGEEREEKPDAAQYDAGIIHRLVTHLRQLILGPRLRIAVLFVNALSDGGQNGQPEDGAPDLQRDVEDGSYHALIRFRGRRDDDEICRDVDPTESGNVEDHPREGISPVGSLFRDERKQDDAGNAKRPTDDELILRVLVRLHYEQSNFLTWLTITRGPNFGTKRPAKELKIKALTPKGMKSTAV